MRRLLACGIGSVLYLLAAPAVIAQPSCLVDSSPGQVVIGVEGNTDIAAGTMSTRLALEPGEPADAIQAVIVYSEPSRTPLRLHWNGEQQPELRKSALSGIEPLATTSTDEPAAGRMWTVIPAPTASDTAVSVEVLVGGQWAPVARMAIDTSSYKFSLAFDSPADSSSLGGKMVRVCCNCQGPGGGCSYCLDCRIPYEGTCTCPGCGLTCN